MVGILCAVNLALVVTLVRIINQDRQKTQFNKGRCPKCGMKLRFFMDDWLIGRGYICDNCDYTAWVKYKAVYRDYE